MTTFVLSKGLHQNSHGFAIDLDGIDLERFKKNPVMLWGHDRDKVIGRWTNLRIENGSLLADADFDTDDTVGKEVARKVGKGYLKGCSVGIYIKEMMEKDGITIAAKSELLEASVVSVPSDSDAVMLYDANNKPTTLEAVKLSINQINKTMKENQIELTTATLQALSLESGATAQAVELAVADKNKRIAELEAKVAEYEKARVTELVDKAIADKKIGADEKDTYVSLATKDFEGVNKILSKMKGVAPISTELNVQGSASKYEGKTWDELDHAGLLASLKAEAPEKYEEMYKQKFNLK